MATYLFIAGHGELYGTGFDPGATGYVKMGEHKYYEDLVFPKMQKYVPDGEKVVLFSAYDVYTRANITKLAQQYGKDTVVVECHLDAASAPTATGGHVIIGKDYAPDEIDLRLRDFIKDMVGLRTVYNHRGNVGISGRDDLQNLNLTVASGVNYRLIELGFVTNKTDANILLTQTEKIAEGLVKAVVGRVKPQVKVDAAIATEKQLQKYQGRNADWKTLKVGDTVTIREGMQRYLNSNFKQMEVAKKEWIGKKYPITDKKAVKIGYSDYAYKLGGLGLFVLEQDLTEVRDNQKVDSLYRVQTGSFKNKDNADKMLKQLKDNGYKDAFIKRE